MNDRPRPLKDDDQFRTRAARVHEPQRVRGVRALDWMYDRLERFTSVRRREARLALLERSGRESAEDWRSHHRQLPEALAAFGDTVTLLAEHARELRPLITPALDDVIALAADEEHPLRKTLHEVAISLGFSGEETKWLFGELEALGYRPTGVLCGDGFEDLVTLLDGISVGQNGILAAGFARFTGDPSTDERLEKLVVRLRNRGATASIFLVIVIVVTAHLVATEAAHP